MLIVRGMITSFKDKETEKIWNGEFSKRFPASIQTRVRAKLQRIHAAPDLNALRMFPSDRLHALSGKLRGLWSISVNDQFRIIFRWTADGNAEIVQLIDYH